MSADATTYLLLPDAREEGEAFEALNKRLDELRGPGVFLMGFAPTWYHGRFPAPHLAQSEGIDPNEIVRRVAEIDWLYQPILEYRPTGESAWSFLKTARTRR